MHKLFMSVLFAGHKHWVLCIAWSPDGKKLASGCKNSQVRRICIGSCKSNYYTNDHNFDTFELIWKLLFMHEKAW